MLKRLYAENQQTHHVLIVLVKMPCLTKSTVWQNGPATNAQYTASIQSRRNMKHQMFQNQIFIDIRALLVAQEMYL